jgi:hypothetical protein
MNYQENARFLIPASYLIMSYLWNHGHILLTPIESPVKCPFQPSLLLNDSFHNEETPGAPALDSGPRLWNQFEPVVACSLCQKERSLPLASGPLILALAWAACYDRRLPGLQHVRLSRAGCEHVSAGNHAKFQQLGTHCTDHYHTSGRYCFKGALRFGERSQ